MKEFQELIEATRNAFVFAVDRLQNGVDTTPEDKLAWKPAESARSVLGVAVHSAISIGDILDMLQGRRFDPADFEAADAFHLQRERAITTRQQANELLREKREAFLVWLADLRPEDLDKPFNSPFGMEPVPVRVAMTFPALHTNNHVGQIEYIQTLYGDRVWR